MLKTIKFNLVGVIGIIFFIWLNLSPVPTKKVHYHLDLNDAKIETSNQKFVRGGGNEFSNSNSGMNHSNHSGSVSFSGTSSNGVASKDLKSSSGIYTTSASNPGGGNNPSYSGNDLDDFVSPKIPEKEDLITHESFWELLSKQDTSNNQCLLPENDDWYNEDEFFDSEMDEKDKPGLLMTPDLLMTGKPRRLSTFSFAIPPKNRQNVKSKPQEMKYMESQNNPNSDSNLQPSTGLLATPDSASASVPTKQLDKILKVKYDLTVLDSDLLKLSNYNYLDRHGRKMVIALTPMKTLVYAHANDLDIFSMHRINCPVQPNPNLYQRTHCYGIDNDAMFELYDRIIQLTTNTDSNRYVTILAPKMPFYDTQPCLMYLDKVEGYCLINHLDTATKPSKLWTATKLNRAERLAYLTDPNCILNPPPGTTF